MFADRKTCITSAERKKINGQREGESEKKGRIAITACYTANKVFDTQRRFDKIKAKSENFTVDDAANDEGINKITVGNETTSEKDFATVFDATDGNEKKNKPY